MAAVCLKVEGRSLPALYVRPLTLWPCNLSMLISPGFSPHALCSEYMDLLIIPWSFHVISYFYASTYLFSLSGITSLPSTTYLPEKANQVIKITAWHCLLLRSSLNIQTRINHWLFCTSSISGTYFLLLHFSFCCLITYVYFCFPITLSSLSESLCF